MSHKQAECRTERIELFLHQQLSDNEQADFERHLDDCGDCCRRLEQSAAAEEVWPSIRESLHEESPSLDSEDCSGSTDAAASEAGPPFSVDSVLQLLAPTDDDRMLGRLGAYEVLGIIGTGGMGVVLKAFDPALNRYVAIKILSPHLGNSGAARKRFSREAQAAAAVVHDNVIEIHGVADANGLPYLVMPYVRGPSLQKRLDDEGPLSVVEILRIGKQAAAGLAAAHAQGLVHRDVKPANILLADGIERLKLTDFGLARAADDASLTKTGVIAGTPQYMSPEQARGDGIDATSDLFSLGSVMYTMCTGRPPFRAETSYGILRRITDTEPRPIREINPEISDWLCGMIAKLMAKNPDDRFASASEVAELLEDCLAHVQQPTAVPLPECCLSLRESSKADQPDCASGRFAPTGSKPWASAQRLIRSPHFKLIAGAAFAFTIIFTGILIVLELNKGILTIESEADNVPIKITQGEKTVERLTVTKDGASVRIAAGEYLVEVDGAMDGIAIDGGSVTLQRRGVEVVTINEHPREKKEFELDWMPLTDAISNVLPSIFGTEPDRFVSQIVLGQLPADWTTKVGVIQISPADPQGNIWFGKWAADGLEALVVSEPFDKAASQVLELSFECRYVDPNKDPVWVLNNVLVSPVNKGQRDFSRFLMSHPKSSALDTSLSFGTLKQETETGPGTVDHSGDEADTNGADGDSVDRVSKLIASLVTIDYQGSSPDASAAAFGIGWVIDQQGTILTLGHIVPEFEEERFTIRYAGGKETSATRLKTQGRLALLKPTKAEPVSPIALADDVPLAVGDGIIGILNATDGSRGKVVAPRKTVVLSDGPGYRISPPLRFFNAIETDLRANEATHNGAPLLTSDGKLIGMLVIMDRQNMIAIPLSEIRTLVQQLTENSTTSIEFRLAWAEPAEGLTELVPAGSEQSVYVRNEPIATNGDVASAKVIDDPNGKPAVEVTFKEEAAQRLGEATARHVGHPLAILVDGKLLSAPTIQERLGRRGIITGNFSRQEAERIAQALNGAEEARVPGTDELSEPHPPAAELVRRSERWEIRYPSDPKTFARALDFFGIEIGVAGGGTNEITYLSAVSGESPAVRRGLGVKEWRLYFTPRDQGLTTVVRHLATQAGIETNNRLVLLFYPPGVANALAALESEHAKDARDDHEARTSFEMRAKGNGFEWHVISQTHTSPAAGRPLSDAIREFNQRQAENPIGKDQPPLTDDEVVASVRWALLDANGEKTPEQIRGLTVIATQRVLPEGWSIQGGSAVFAVDKTDGPRGWHIYLSHKLIRAGDGGIPRNAHDIRIRLLTPTPRELPDERAEDDPDGTPLAAAIREFNRQHSTIDGRRQPPLTEDEAVAAIEYWIPRQHESSVIDKDFAAFQRIAQTRSLPAGTRFEMLGRYQPGDGVTYSIWSVRIRMPKSDGGTYAFTIRDQFISMRDAGRIAWGPPAANGLQAGVRFSPVNETYQVGQKIEAEFFYRASGGKVLQGVIPGAFSHAGVEAFDPSGKPLKTLEQEAIKTLSGFIAGSFDANPVSMGKRPIQTADPGRYADELAAKKANPFRAGDTLLFAGPGQSCRVRFIVPNHAEGGQGTLKTGEIAFKIVEAPPGQQQEAAGTVDPSGDEADVPADIPGTSRISPLAKQIQVFQKERDDLARVVAIWDEALRLAEEGIKSGDESLRPLYRENIPVLRQKLAAARAELDEAEERLASAKQRLAASGVIGQNVVPLPERWEIRYANHETLFARALDHFGIEIGVIDPKRGNNEQVSFLSSFDRYPPSERKDDQRLYFAAQSGSELGLCRTLAGRRSVDTRGCLVILLYPQDVQETLARLETQRAKGRPIDQGQKTVFEVLPNGSDFEFHVVSQDTQEDTGAKPGLSRQKLEARLAEIERSFENLPTSGRLKKAKVQELEMPAAEAEQLRRVLGKPAPTPESTKAK